MKLEFLNSFYYSQHGICFVYFLMHVLSKGVILTGQTRLLFGEVRFILVHWSHARLKHRPINNLFIGLWVKTKILNLNLNKELNLLMSSVHLGRKPNCKRVYVSLNRTSQNSDFDSFPNQIEP